MKPNFSWLFFKFDTSWCYKSHELAQASLSWGTIAQVRDMAHGPFVIDSKQIFFIETL